MGPREWPGDTMQLPPPLLGSDTPVWLGKLVGGGITKVGAGAAAVGSVALVNAVADPDPHSIKHNLWEFGLSVPAGAAIGAAAGVFFPQMAGKGATQMEAMRAGAVQGGLSAPIVAVAGLLMARTILGDWVPGPHEVRNATAG